jgi:hypothetical protein
LLCLVGAALLLPACGGSGGDEAATTVGPPTTRAPRPVETTTTVGRPDEPGRPDCCAEDFPTAIAAATQALAASRDACTLFWLFQNLEALPRATTPDEVRATVTFGADYFGAVADLIEPTDPGGAAVLRTGSASTLAEADAAGYDVSVVANLPAWMMGDEFNDAMVSMIDLTEGCG